MRHFALVTLDDENLLSRKSKRQASRDSFIYCSGAKEKERERESAISTKLIPVKVENYRNYRRAGRRIISQLAVVFVGETFAAATLHSNIVARGYKCKMRRTGRGSEMILQKYLKYLARARDDCNSGEKDTFTNKQM